MKNPSKEKPPTTVASQNRLNKTQAPQKAVETFDNTYYGQGKNTVEQPKQVPQQLPPRSGSSQKINYKVSDNMTNSKIQQAKKGLQLLKKKMSRNGMSRQKNSSVQKKQEYIEQAVSKKTIQKPMYEQQEGYYPQKQLKKPPPRAIQKQQSKEEMNKKSPPIPTKIVDKSPPIGSKANMDDRPIKRNPPKQQFVNELQEVPIKANQDFFAILQRQMAKENNKGGAKQNKPVAKKQQMYQQQSQNIELIECSKGCQRKFNRDAIQKHERICEKVFLTKRKAFDAAAQRKLQEQGFKQPQQPPPPSKPQKMKKATTTVTEQKIPKWKLQSAAFRAGLKQGRGQALTGQQKAMSQQANGMTQCPCCGRKFNADAAKRHIPICEAKSKQMPKMITKKK